MAGNSNKQPNNWLSNILRPRASSITVESCLNLPNSDPSTPLDARPVLPLLEATQTLPSRCKHLAVFSDICKSYKFTNLDNVFFAVQDILDPSMPREARHYVFEFMLACIVGQYAELGMARVTFYSFLRNYTYWEDFNDMFRVLSALCKGGRDVSGFEKNVSKLLIHWLDVILDSDILHLLTNTCKFNFALFEESEVTHMIEATHEAFFQSQHKDDMNACLEFADIVVRYRFVPFSALTPFLDMLCAAVMLPDHHSSTLCWPIFSNLLRSHCAHSAILTLCKFLENRSDAENLVKGAIVLLSETAWGKKNKVGSDTYMVSDSVLLVYLKRGAKLQNDTINASILSSLALLLENPNTVSLMDWEAIWDIVDVCTLHVVTVLGEGPLFHQRHHQSPGTEQYIKWIQLVMSQYNAKTYKGPVVRFMNVLYALKRFASEETACILLDYYVMEHLLLPSSEDWIDLLQDITETFFIHTHVSTIVRVRMLDIVTSVCEAVKDFYSEEINEKMVVPMMEKLYLESDPEIRQRAIDLIVASLDDCKKSDVFDTLLGILRECARCHCDVANEEPRQRSNKKSLFHESGTDQRCLGVSPTLGLCDLFQRFLPTLDGELCKKIFDVITDIANDKSDLNCPFGGPKLVALDLLLRLRCPTNHHLYLVHD
ncbi:hypothetical protein K501DRAFT_269939, partial [Backusella circina FSU 941]